MRQRKWIEIGVTIEDMASFQSSSIRVMVSNRKRVQLQNRIEDALEQVRAFTQEEVQTAQAGGDAG